MLCVELHRIARNRVIPSIDFGFERLRVRTAVQVALRGFRSASGVFDVTLSGRGIAAVVHRQLHGKWCVNVLARASRSLNGYRPESFDASDPRASSSAGAGIGSSRGPCAVVLRRVVRDRAGGEAACSATGRSHRSAGTDAWCARRRGAASCLRCSKGATGSTSTRRPQGAFRGQRDGPGPDAERAHGES